MDLENKDKNKEEAVIAAAQAFSKSMLDNPALLIFIAAILTAINLSTNGSPALLLMMAVVFLIVAFSIKKGFKKGGDNG